MSGLGGISIAAVLVAINVGLQGADDERKANLWAVTLFLVALFLFVRAQYYVTITTAAEIEAIVHRLRMRVVDLVRHSELLAMEEIGRANIVASITSDAAVLTQASALLSITAQGAALVLFVTIYVAFLSFAVFATAVAVVSTAGIILHLRNRRVIAEKQVSAEWERRLFDRLADFLDGFKEVRLNSQRSDDLFEDAGEVSRRAANIKIRSQAETFKMIVTSQFSMYLLIGAVVFVAPQLSDTLGGISLTKTTTALMFVVGACFGLVQSIPVMLNANAAADRIERLEAALRASAATPKPGEIRISKQFDQITMRKIVFRYLDRFSDTTFQIGPLDFSLHSGELVFITGGNGSGKSTFLRVLAGLYPPDSGDISFDGIDVNNTTRDAYRALMAAIFSDYHLFKRLYGIAESELGDVSRLLRKFRLADKTVLSDDEFSTLDLSGGQRKRLALIVSLLEKRPILLLDEWTAEQDPEFRRKFYIELLPEMMQAGLTIVMITHDDRYLDELNISARRFRMDEGRLVEERSIQKA